jgi:hypothetical protein
MHREIQTRRPAYFAARSYTPTTMAWSRSKGSRVSCSLGLMPISLSLVTSCAKTASGAAVESMQLALMEMTMPPPTLRKRPAVNN